MDADVRSGSGPCEKAMSAITSGLVRFRKGPRSAQGDRESVVGEGGAGPGRLCAREGSLRTRATCRKTGMHSIDTALHNGPGTYWNGVRGQESL